MLLLLDKVQREVVALEARLPGHVGRLVTPRRPGDPAEVVGLPWAIDNGAFASGGFDEAGWLRLLSRYAALPGCLFVTAPDVVGDAAATTELWHRWLPVIRAAGLPPGYVLQDGVRSPPEGAAAWFVGGTTAFKYEARTLALIAEAKRRGIHVHMGRVNSTRRLRFAASHGVDSVDGSMWARFTETYAHRLAALPFTQERLA